MSSEGTDTKGQRDFINGDDGGQAAVHNEHYRSDVEANRAHVAKPNQPTVSQVYNPSFFKIGNPGPLGLISFAVSAFVLGFYHSGVGLPDSNPLGDVGPDQAVFGLAVFLGGGIQFVAGVMEFRVGNTFGCTVHCAYGGFWISYAMFLVPTLGIQAAYAGDQRAFTVAIGIFLMAWFLLTVIFFIAALRTNIAILLLLFFLALTFFFIGVSRFIAVTHPVAATRVNRAGGAFCIICSLVAFYAGSSGLMTEETTWVRFPLGEIEGLMHRRSK